jgi:hypothetical protein
MGAQVLDILSINHIYVVIWITTQNKNTHGCGKQKTVPDYNDTTSYVTQLGPVQDIDPSIETFFLLE